MPIAIHTPRTLISRHPDAFAISLILFLIGFMLGMQPQYSQAIIEEAQKRQVEPTATITNFKEILLNNGLISAVLWLGWFLPLFFGIACLPPAIMIYNVGAAFGAVVSYVSPAQSVITLLSFGILEALGFILALAGGLLFPKYVILKLFGKSVQFIEMLKDTVTILFYSFMFLFSGAIFEAMLINPLTMIVGLIGGLLTTFFGFCFLVAKSGG